MLLITSSRFTLASASLLNAWNGVSVGEGLLVRDELGFVELSFGNKKLLGEVFADGPTGFVF